MNTFMGPGEDASPGSPEDGAARASLPEPPEDAAAQRRYQRIPPRKSLPHQVPLWIDPANEIYFITICCEQRGVNQLAFAAIADALFETIRHRHERGVWFAHLALLMPDHVHVLLSFPDTGKRIQTVISKWKEWTAKSLRIQWQRDFFEHRLRKEESLRQKADYLLLNPVRAGLVAQPEDWPFVLVADSRDGVLRRLSE